MKSTIPFLLVFLVGCSTAPVTTEEVQHLSYSCSNVDTNITMLKEEKKENNKRVLNGIKAVFPVAVIRSLFQGHYKENVKIATGEWANVLDEEIVKMETFKAQC